MIYNFFILSTTIIPFFVYYPSMDSCAINSISWLCILNNCSIAMCHYYHNYIYCNYAISIFTPLLCHKPIIATPHLFNNIIIVTPRQVRKPYDGCHVYKRRFLYLFNRCQFFHQNYFLSTLRCSINCGLYKQVCLKRLRLHAWRTDCKANGFFFQS